MVILPIELQNELISGHRSTCVERVNNFVSMVFTELLKCAKRVEQESIKCNIINILGRLNDEEFSKFHL